MYKIFQLLGTPSENEWSGYTTLPDYQACFPKWNKKNMSQVIGSDQPIEAIQLLERVCKVLWRIFLNYLEWTTRCLRIWILWNFHKNFKLVASKRVILRNVKSQFLSRIVNHTYLDVNLWSLETNRGQGCIGVDILRR